MVVVFTTLFYFITLLLINMAWYSFLLNIDVIAIIIVAAITIYLIFNRKKGTNRTKYTFSSIVNPEALFIPVQREVKKKKKKKLYKHEERCREIFQDIFKREFKSVRPKWLKNPATGRNLELDGYCPDTGVRHHLGSTAIAFEMDGIQHAQYTPHFHRSGPKEFLYQDKKDSYKSQVCKDRKILLIRIPHYVVYEDLDRYIRDRLRVTGLSISGGGMYG